MTSWSNLTKNIASWSDAIKHAISNYFLLKEDGFYLLLETGDKIILEDSGGAGWSNASKSTTSWGNQTKN